MKEKEQANSFAAFKNAELRRNGVEHAEFLTALRVMAQNAVEQLKPFGKTITDAVRHYVAHLQASEKSCTAAQLVKELVAAKKAEGVSERHLRDIRSRLSVFAQKFDDQMVATITSRDIDNWLRCFRSRRSRAITTGNLWCWRSTSRCALATPLPIQRWALPRRRWSVKRREFSL